MAATASVTVLAVSSPYSVRATCSFWWPVYATESSVVPSASTSCAAVRRGSTGPWCGTSQSFTVYVLLVLPCEPTSIFSSRLVSATLLPLSSTHGSLDPSHATTDSSKKSATSTKLSVMPHATWRFMPNATPGMPARLAPIASISSEPPCAAMWLRYQTGGLSIGRCGSLATSTLPVAESAGPTTQLFEPTSTWRISAPGIPRREERSASSTGSSSPTSRGARRAVVPSCPVQPSMV